MSPPQARDLLFDVTVWIAEHQPMWLESWHQAQMLNQEVSDETECDSADCDREIFRAVAGVPSDWHR